MLDRFVYSPFSRVHLFDFFHLDLNLKKNRIYIDDVQLAWRSAFTDGQGFHSTNVNSSIMIQSSRPGFIVSFSQIVLSFFARNFICHGR